MLLRSLDLSSLKYTTGDLTIEASGGSYSCFSLNARQKRKTFIRGTYRCSSGSTLTTGAKVGIGIGVPATVVIVAGAIVFWWRRRCRSTMSAREDKLAAMQDSESVESESPHRAVEADDKRRIELQSIPRILEMDDSAELKELESPVTASELSGGRMHVLAS